MSRQEQIDWVEISLARIYPGGYSLKIRVGMCGPLPKTLTLLMTKICDIPYPIYDRTKNSKSYLRPEPYIKILFQTCVIIGSQVQTNVKFHNKISEGLLLPMKLP